MTSFLVLLGTPKGHQITLFFVSFSFYLCNCFQDGGDCKPARMKAAAKIEHSCRCIIKPEPSNIMIMSEEMKQVADLITANIISTQKEVLTSDEAARYLGVSKSCLYKWTMSRAIPHFKSPTGKMCFFNRKEIENWMQSIRVATDEELEIQARKMARKGGMP